MNNPSRSVVVFISAKPTAAKGKQMTSHRQHILATPIARLKRTRWYFVVGLVLCVLLGASVAFAEIQTLGAVGSLGTYQLYASVAQIPNNTVTETIRDVTLISVAPPPANQIAHIDTYSSNPDIEVRAVNVNNVVTIVVTGTRPGNAVVGWGYSINGGGDGGTVGLKVVIQP